MNYSHFILPFSIGAIILFVIIIVKFTKWFRLLDRKQKYFIKRNIFTTKTISATIEAFREALIHRNIYKKNPLLGYMHMSLAFGWFLLIVVGKIEASVYSGTFLKSLGLLFSLNILHANHIIFGELNFSHLQWTFFY